MRFLADVLIYGTAYVEADTADEARARIADVFGCDQSPECISLGRREIVLDEGVVLSTEITSHGIAEGSDVELAD